VKTAIQNDKIKVVYVASMGSKNGAYRYTHNELRLGFKRADSDFDRQALIIHECTHAIFDIAGKPMTVSDSESAAYIAQCLYFYYVNQAAIDGGAKATFANAILSAAWDAAMKAIKKPDLTEDDLKALRKAISENSKYKDRHNKKDKYDGI